MLAEMQSHRATLQNNLIASSKTKYALIWWSSKHALGNLSQRNENLYHAKMCMQMLKTTQLGKAKKLQTSQINKLVYPYHEMLLSKLKKNT